MKRYLTEMARHLPGVVDAPEPTPRELPPDPLEVFLAETDYDSLSAKNASAVVKGVGEELLARLRDHEATNKNRKTVLSAIDAEVGE